MKSEITPGEWQVDKFGRRFREVGNVREYEMELVTSNGTFPSSQASEIGSRMREERQKQLEKEMRKASKPLFCPIKALKNSCSAVCSGDRCVFFETDNCSLKKETAPRASQGKYCPYMGSNCKDICAMYEDGCKITNV